MKNKTVLVSGNFNIIHPGHLRLFRFAKDCADRLIVVVKGDSSSGEGAHLAQNFRLDGVLSQSIVDEAFISDDPITSIIARIRPDIVVKGKEHEDTNNPEVTALEQYGGKLLFSSGETIFSSLDLIRRELKTPDVDSIDGAEEYLSRHSIDQIRIKKLVGGFARLKICVIGDLIIDEYITCEALGMSQEDPTIVVTPVDSMRFVGGAGIVASHACGLGANVNFFSVTGADDIGRYALNELISVGVYANLLTDDSRPTTLKQRFRSKGKTLLRVSHLHQGAISTKIQNEIFSLVESTLSQVDLLIFSDFNYGCLPQSLVNKILAAAKKSAVMIAADSQSSSQTGDIARFKEADLLTPTEHEARISVRNREDGLVVLAEQLRKEASAKNVLLKLGEEGLMVHATKEGGWLTDQIGALNGSPRDVSGAGDSLLVASAMTLAAGGNIWEAAYIGALAAAVQVGRVGNTPLSPSDLVRELAK
jgi:rfaE bifunctional protein kinase chain/domain